MVTKLLSRTPEYNVYCDNCPTRLALDRIADKWTALIIGLLAEKPYRFGELRRAIEGISQKVLTQTLRSLEQDGLVSRQTLTTVPTTVEYTITKLGHSLTGPWRRFEIGQSKTLTKSSAREKE